MIVCLVIINAVGFVLMSADKLSAVKKSRRIPESTLLLSALLGGGIGCTAGMLLCRHKIRKRMFSWGLPAITVLQIAALLYSLYQ